MKIQTFLNLLYLALILVVVGCAGVSKALNDNELLSYIVIRDSVAQYIDKRDGDKRERAGRFVKAAESAENFIAQNPTATVGTVIDTAKLAVNYDAIALADRLLIDDLLLIIKSSIDKQRTSKQLPDNYLVDMRKVIGAVKAGAVIFL